MHYVQEYLKNEIGRVNERILGYQNDLGLLRECEKELKAEATTDTIKQLRLLIKRRISDLSKLREIAEQKRSALMGFYQLAENEAGFPDRPKGD